MKYYIIGGNGFVGRYLAKELARLNREVVVCDLQPCSHEMIPAECTYRQVDIRSKESLEYLFENQGGGNFYRYKSCCKSVSYEGPSSCKRIFFQRQYDRNI